jgi:3-methyladenine DNA glycosylase AlkD
VSETTVAEVMAELAALEDPKAREVNERHGDDHGVNLGKLRLAWSADSDPVVASGGWALTTERVAKKPEGLDLPGLLKVIEAEMSDAPDRLQWAMNHCLA